MRGNSSHAALTTKIDIHNKDGQKVGEKEVVTYAGVLALAHEEGLRSIRTKLVQTPNKENGQTAIVTAIVRTNKGVFAGIGDANPENVNRRIAPHLIRMAETRAKARALKDSVNVGIVALEELGELVGDELSPAPLSPANQAPARPRPQAGASNQSHPANDNGAASSTSNLPTVSETAFVEMSGAQRGRLFRIAGERGVAESDREKWLLGQLEVQTLTAVSRSAASRAITRLENGKPKGGGNGVSPSGMVQ
jgi:hypothetical protein